MVRIQIGNSERTLTDHYENWVNQQIIERQRANQLVCVQVFINDRSANMALATPTCASGSGGGGGRAPNALERSIFDLWNRHRLSTSNFSSGDVVAFLKQLERAL